MRRLFYLFFIVLLSTLSVEAQSNSCLSFSMDAAQGNVGDTICLDVTVNDFDNIIGMQYSFGWDPQSLSLIEFTNFNIPNLTVSNFNIQSGMLAQGQSAISWFDLTNPSGLSLADGSTIYSLCFEVLSTSGGEVSFTDQPTTVEIVGGTTQVLNQFSFINGGIGDDASGIEVAIDDICLNANSCGDDQSADITISGGQAPYAYEWEDASGTVVANTQDVSGLSQDTYFLTLTDANGNIATATSYMYVESGLNVEANLTNPTCDLVQDGAINLIVGGGSGSYSSIWSNGASTLSLQGLSAGSYTVTVTDDVNGCTASETFTLVDGNNMITSYSYECTDDIADIHLVVWAGGTPPYIYEWSTGFIDTSTNMLSTLSNVPDETAYSVTITSQEGCSQVENIDPFTCGAVEGDFLVAHSYECIFFQDIPALANLSVVIWDGGVFPHTFNWSTGEETVADNPMSPVSTISVLGNGIYYVTITDAQGTFMEYGPMVLDCDEDGIELNLNASVNCLTDSTASITVTADGGTPPYTFEWSNGAVMVDNQTGETTITDDGIYAVTVTDSEGNTGFDDDINVECGLGNPSDDFLVAHAFECLIFSDTTIADITVVVWTGGTMPYTYEWSTGEVQTISDPMLPAGTISVDGNGTYFVTITDINGLSEVYGPLSPDCGPPNGTPVTFTAGSADVEEGESFCVDVTVEDFYDVVSFQFSMNWDADTIQFDSILIGTTLPFYNGNNFNLTQANDGVLITQWFHPSVIQVDLPDETVLFSLCFTASTEGSTDLAISSSPVLIEVTDGETTLEVNAVDGLINVSPDDGTDDFLIAHSIDCTIFSDTTIADITVVVWTGGTMPYTYEWSTGEVQTISDPMLPAGTISVDGNGTYFVTITDINGLSEVYGPLSPDCGPPNGTPVTFTAGSADVEEGESFCVDVTVEDFYDVVSFQFSMNWDADTIQFDSILIGTTLPFYNGNNFNLTQVNNGGLITQWFHPSVIQVDLPDETVLFSLCFTASTEGSTDLAFSNSPAVIEVTDGESTLAINMVDGFIDILSPDVWPGDTDNDEGVDHYDLLNIGLAYGATGPERSDATIVWEAQYADDWGQATPMSEVDYKHVDANGDGFIDAADTLAIAQNWGEISNFGAPDPVRSSNGIIYVQPDTLILGEPNIFNIVMAQGGTPIEDVYGLAFTIVYDTTAVEAGSTYASFLESWIGNDNDDMLTFYRDRYEDGRIDISMTRIDGLNMTGEGVIGQLHITIQDVIFLRSGNYEMIFDIENVKVIDYQEQTIAITPQQSVSIVKDAVNGTNNISKSIDLNIYPNPVTEVLHLQTDAQIEAVELITTSGQLIHRYGITNVINVNDLATGVYFLKVWTDQGFLSRRVSVIR